MNETPSNLSAPTEVRETRRGRLRRLILLIFVISIGVHLLAGIGAGVWVIARNLIQPKAQFVVKKQVKMDAEDRRHQLQMDELSSLRPKAVYNNRIQSLRPSKLALPELPRVPLENLTPIDTDALITDQVDGIGKYGDGTGNGEGNGNGAGAGFFGGKGAAGSGLLAGNLYDLKRDSSGKDTSMAKEAVMSGNAIIIDPVVSGAYMDVCNRLSRSSSAGSVLGRFYKAPDTLFLSQVSIPNMGADAAPREFNVTDMKPRYWLAVYEGRATAPETGNYKFLGNADDVLLVKINNRLVLDGSIGNTSRLHGKEGATFHAEKGKAYDIEIIIGEAPGGSFHAWLQIQKDNEKPYWFRMSDKPVEYSAPGPPEKINGPIWWPAAKKADMPGLGL